ncbi:MAG TPA: mechanosensitive ion channel family protein [Myxococcota bacterium]|nr:mechanosensitive ion channel family protein [Myxococcota bacterium]
MEHTLSLDWQTFMHVVTTERTLALVRAVVVVTVAGLVAPLLRRAVTRVMGSRWAPQQIMLARRVVTYVVLGVGATTALRELGFELSVLLGAAGVVTVALGFASQTSVSNLISGLFLIGEQPFVIGDTIQLDKVTGEVLAIDLLSVKLRTFDNLYVRIPNEAMLKSVVTNLSRFPIRRLDMEIGVAYKEDIARVQRILFDVADKNPLGLDDPKPLFVFLGYGDSALRMQFSVWGKRETFVDLKNSIYNDIKAAFDRHGIELPFPHQTVVGGREPLSVRIIETESRKTA